MTIGRIRSRKTIRVLQEDKTFMQRAQKHTTGDSEQLNNTATTQATGPLGCMNHRTKGYSLESFSRRNSLKLDGIEEEADADAMAVVQGLLKDGFEMRKTPTMYV